MAYRWKPSKSQRREFAQKMNNDADFAAAYYARKEAAAEKRRSNSSFDYSSAGGFYVPTKIQNDAAFKLLGDNPSKEQADAANQVISAYATNEKTHHDNIHIINEYIRHGEKNDNSEEFEKGGEMDCGCEHKFEEGGEFNEEILNQKEEVSDVPVYWGKGKNLDVFGYQTKHFENSPGAYKTFSEIIEDINSGKEVATDSTKEALKLCASTIDDVLNLEEITVSVGVEDEQNYINAFSLSLRAQTFFTMAGQSKVLDFLFVHVSAIDDVIDESESEKNNEELESNLTDEDNGEIQQQSLFEHSIEDKAEKGKHLTDKFVEFGNIIPLGNGELVASVYVDGSFFGEVFGNNGTQEGEEAYFPTVDEYIESHKKEIEEFEGGGVSFTCPYCGEVYFSCDQRYIDEYPTSSDMAAAQAFEEHYDNFCEENNDVKLRNKRANEKKGAYAMEEHPAGWKALVEMLEKRGMSREAALEKVRSGTKLNIPKSIRKYSNYTGGRRSTGRNKSEMRSGGLFSGNSRYVFNVEVNGNFIRPINIDDAVNEKDAKSKAQIELKKLFPDTFSHYDLIYEGHRSFKRGGKIKSKHIGFDKLARKIEREYEKKGYSKKKAKAFGKETAGKIRWNIEDKAEKGKHLTAKQKHHADKLMRHGEKEYIALEKAKKILEKGGNIDHSKLRILIAKELGELAFEKGEKNIPALDKNLMDLLEVNEIGDPENIPILMAWNKGWNEANLKSKNK